MIKDKHFHLAEEALILKKAWLVAAALLGAGGQISESQLVLPNYLFWDDKRLKLQIADLRDDFAATAKLIFQEWKPGVQTVAIKWFAAKYDQWVEANDPIFVLGLVHEVERAIGKLAVRRTKDCPPYAQVLWQGFTAPAIRHPEYHLARDLALLYNLYLDSEQISDDAQRRKEHHTSEDSQSLGRSVILGCFNLLESFLSGIATAYVMEHPDAPEKTVASLKDNRLSLRKKMLLFPGIIDGSNVALKDTEPPFKRLFGEFKERRDSFVHCEPGPEPTKWGYIKEQRFHDVTKSIVSETVTLTCDAIGIAWKMVHKKERPTWLPQRNTVGKFDRVRLSLRPIEPSAP